MVMDRWEGEAMPTERSSSSIGSSGLQKRSSSKVAELG